MFKKLDNFRFWSQKILPLVYDDSLSYYEVLCKLTAILNDVINNINELPEIIQELVSDERLKEILSDLLDELREQIASANEKNSETATADRNKGEYVWLNGELWQVTRNILAGDRYIKEEHEGVTPNVEKITIESQIVPINDKIISIQEKLNNLKIINILDFGAQIGEDIALLLNRLISEYNGYVIYVPTGEYKVSTPINVDMTGELIIDGTLKSEAYACLNVTACSRLKVHKIAGLGANSDITKVGIQITGHTWGTGRMTIDVDYITQVGFGIYLFDDTDVQGILRNTINFNYIDFVNCGIVFETNSNTGFINQNVFYGGGIEASDAGIWLKNTPHIDPYNGNMFVNISLEGCTYPIRCYLAERNLFVGMRLYENTGDTLIYMDSTTKNNLFIGSCVTLFNLNSIEDYGNNQYINMPINVDSKQYLTNYKSSNGSLSDSVDIHANYIKGVAPENSIFKSMNVLDLDGNLMHQVGGVYYNNGGIKSFLRCYNQDGSGNSEISIGYNSDGTIYTSAPTPATGDSSNNIATTRFVDNTKEAYLKVKSYSISGTYNNSTITIEKNIYLSGYVAIGIVGIIPDFPGVMTIKSYDVESPAAATAKIKATVNCTDSRTANVAFKVLYAKSNGIYS